MSVRADQRSESSLLFYKIARELRREISCDLLNKFNSKNETFTTEENTVVNQKEQYPAYMVDFIRKDILGLLQKLMQYISIANSIYPACVLEVDKRRLLQDYAIGTAEALQNELDRKQIAEFYSSWRGFMQYFDSKILLKNTDKLYNKLFIKG